MAPDSAVVTENETEDQDDVDIKDKVYYNKSDVPLKGPRNFEIKYQSLVILLAIHLSGLYGLYLSITSAKRGTLIFNYIYFIIGGFGITAGAHRLWAHRTYKAKPAFEFALMLCNCVAFQQTVIKWVRDHRLHHKYSDTDADPHNARRGFFYSHVGWLMVKKNDLVKERGKTIDNSDIENNPILQFQKKYAVPLFSTACFILPTVIPMIFFGESLWNAWYVSMFRYAMNLNGSLLVNSFAHIYGGKPYDKNILPTQNWMVSIFSGGEGFHNYHHAFPWDYRTAELGNNYFNSTTMVLDFFSKLGWVYDLKTVKPEMIKKKAKSSGDGSNSWGYKL